MSGDNIRAWFRCPLCGDDGEVVQAKVGGSVNLEFKCTNRKHRAEYGNFRTYRRNEWRRSSDPPIWHSLWRSFLSDDIRQRITSLQGALECPSCGSESTDGALERIVIGEYSHEKALLGVTTLWCLDCGEVARSWIRVNNKTIDYEEVADKSDFPPDYV